MKQSTEAMRSLIRYSLDAQFISDIDWNNVHWDDTLEFSHSHGIDGLVWGTIERLQNSGVITLSLKDKFDWYGNVRRIQEHNIAVAKTLGILHRVFCKAEVVWIVLRG